MARPLRIEFPGMFHDLTDRAAIHAGDPISGVGISYTPRCRNLSPLPMSRKYNELIDLARYLRQVGQLCT